MPIQIKGITIKSRLDFARARGGEALVDKMRAAPPPVGELAKSGMLSLREFPLAHDDLLCRFIAEQLKAGEKIYREMGAFSADEHRNFQKIVHGAKTDPFELLAGVPRQFHQYLSGDAGSARYEMLDLHSGRIIWEGHKESYLSHCLSSIGYFIRLLEISGVMGARGENTECLAKGDKRCVWDFKWEAATGVRHSRIMKAVTK
jgi:hypothetical protein